MLVIITTINNFIVDFASGRLHESSTHWALIGVIAAAEVSLGIGIWIESPKSKSLREWLGVGLVLVGCVVSALFTVFLLIFDEGISRGQRATIWEQQSKIIALEARIAPRVLSKLQYDAIGTLRGKVRAVSVLSSPDVEPAMFSSQLEAALDDAGIAVNPILAPAGTLWVGTQICLPDNETKESSLWEVFSSVVELEPKPCSFDDPSLSIPKGVPKDVPLIIVGERLPFSPNGKPISLRMRIYPGFGQQRKPRPFSEQRRELRLKSATRGT